MSTSVKTTSSGDIVTPADRPSVAELCGAAYEASERDLPAWWWNSLDYGIAPSQSGNKLDLAVSIALSIIRRAI